jgi:protoheme IX farnesyltransferase
MSLINEVQESRSAVVTLKWMLRIAIFQIIITFAMIVLGGLVHNTGSSLACPDWPTCFGTFFPKMQGGVLVEHSHRLLGSFIGFLCIVQFVLGLKIRKNHRRIYLWTIGLLTLVIYQGVLGGVTVLFRLPPQISTLHLATAEWVFVAFVAQAHRIYRARKPLQNPPVPPPSLAFFGVTVLLIYIQIVYGAAVRHFGYSAACGLGPEYSVLCMDPSDLKPVLWPSVGGSMFHMLHRLLGAAVGACVLGSTLPLLGWAKRRARNSTVRLLAGLSHLVVISQIAVGIWTVSTHIDTVPVTLHLALATLLLGISFFLFHYLSVLKCAVKRRA